MPERHDFKSVAAHSVVDKVPDAWQVQPSHDIGTGQFNFGADARLLHQQSQGSLNVLAYGTGCRSAMLCPPSRGTFQLALRPRLDPDAQRHDQPKR